MHLVCWGAGVECGRGLSTGAGMCQGDVGDVCE